MLFAWPVGTFRYLPHMSAQAADGRFCDFSSADVTFRYVWPCVTSTVTGAWLRDRAPDISPERVMLMFIETFAPSCASTAEIRTLVAFAIAAFTCLPSVAAFGGGPAETDRPGEDEPPGAAAPEPPPPQPATSSTAMTVPATAAAAPVGQRRVLMDVSSRPRIGRVSRGAADAGGAPAGPNPS